MGSWDLDLIACQRLDSEPHRVLAVYAQAANVLKRNLGSRLISFFAGVNAVRLPDTSPLLLDEPAPKDDHGWHLSPHRGQRSPQRSDGSVQVIGQFHGAAWPNQSQKAFRTLWTQLHISPLPSCYG